MLALADQHGYVGASVPGLARIANVNLEQCEAALAMFLGPDPHSRSKEYEGRRLDAVAGGWVLLNHRRVRGERDPDKRREQNRDAQQRLRDRKRQQDNQPSKPLSAQADTEAEEEAEAEAENSQNIEDPARRRAQDGPAPDSGTTTPATLTADLSESDARGAAFAKGFDIQAVARIYSGARDGAGLGKYPLQGRHHERADAALRWALAEDPEDPEQAVHRSAQAYFEHGGDWEKSAGYPFPAWASDPGKWLALGVKATQKRRRTAPDPTLEAEVDLDANAATATSEVGKILAGLKSKRGAV